MLDCFLSFVPALAHLLQRFCVVACNKCITKLHQLYFPVCTCAENMTQMEVNLYWYIHHKLEFTLHINVFLL